MTTERAGLLAACQVRLGYTFRQIALLDQALTHRSYTHEVPENPKDYERLEFLGDAVLGLLVSAQVYLTDATAREGQLSQRRAGLVNREALATLARALDLGRFLLLGRGEDQYGGRDKDTVLAAALEAVLGAVYLDSGFVSAQDVWGRCVYSAGTLGITGMSGEDYKGVLQTRALHLFGCLPAYEVLYEEGPAHQKMFHVQLTLHQEYRCVGRGRRKKAAEQQAAMQLLALLPPAKV